MKSGVYTVLGVWCLVCLLGSQAVAFVLNDGDWTYMTNPMGEDWVVCPEQMPGSAVQRIKDGAVPWNYEHFRFTFANDACLSNRVFPLMNSVNQVDIGPLPGRVLANTVSFFFEFPDAPDQVIECDMRFSNTVNWYTGTGTPAANQFDFWSVAVHEMGHCLGLDHEDRINPPPVMQSSIPAGTTLRQLTADDMAGRDLIYSQASSGSRVSSGGSSGSSGDGGGGCALVPHTPADATAFLAALGNILLPLVAALGLHLWRRQRRG